jgi:hypothetical protein
MSTRVLRSDDYGEHWNTFTIRADGDLAVDPSFTGFQSLLLPIRRMRNAVCGDGEPDFEIDRCRATWNSIATLPLSFFGILGLAVLDGPVGGVYVVTDAADGSFVIEKSVDGGLTWSTASSLFGGNSFALAAGPQGRLFAFPTFFFFGACFDPQVLLSTDGALTWSELPDAGIVAKMSVGHCPYVIPTASHLYVAEPAGSHLTFGVSYDELTASPPSTASAGTASSTTVPQPAETLRMRERDLPPRSQVP